MPVPTHFKFTFRGVFTGTPEIWSFGVKFERTVGGGGDAGVEDVDDATVTTAITDFLASTSAPICTIVKCTDWRCYVIGTDGRMEGNPKIVDVSEGAINGTAALKYPPQIALVATTVALNRGPARFGRFYIPGPAGSMASDMRLSEATATVYAQSVSAFLKKISDAVDLPGTILSASGLNVSPGGGSSGTAQRIDHVEVGRALDTLRSRRTALLEERFADATIDW